MLENDHFEKFSSFEVFLKNQTFMQIDQADIEGARTAARELLDRFNLDAIVRLGDFPDEKQRCVNSRVIKRIEAVSISFAAQNCWLDVYVSSKIITQAYRFIGSLGQVADWFGLNSIKGLKDIIFLEGVDLVKEMHARIVKPISKRYPNETIRNFAKNHKISEGTISHWFKQRGFELLKGNHRKLCKSVIKTAHCEKKTIKQHADELEISPTTLAKYRVLALQKSKDYWARCIQVAFEIHAKRQRIKGNPAKTVPQKLSLLNLGNHVLQRAPPGSKRSLTYD